MIAGNGALLGADPWQVRSAELTAICNSDWISAKEMLVLLFLLRRSFRRRVFGELGRCRLRDGLFHRSNLLLDGHYFLWRCRNLRASLLRSLRSLGRRRGNRVSLALLLACLTRCCWCWLSWSGCRGRFRTSTTSRRGRRGRRGRRKRFQKVQTLCPRT